MGRAIKTFMERQCQTLIDSALSNNSRLKAYIKGLHWSLVAEPRFGNVVQLVTLLKNKMSVAGGRALWSHGLVGGNGPTIQEDPNNKKGPRVAYSVRGWWVEAIDGNP